MNLIPKLDADGIIEDGEYIKCISFCRRHCTLKECRDFYSATHKQMTFITCPHGLSVYIGSDGVTYTCMRERSSYRKEKAKSIANKDEKVYNPVLDSKQLLTLINCSIENSEEEKALLEKRAAIDSITHEVKQLNAQTKDRCDVILQAYRLNDDNVTLNQEDISEIKEVIRSIFVSSSMITSRFSLYDYEKNPDVLLQGSQFNCNVYKKFDKIRKVFKNYLRRNIRIELIGSSYSEIMAYPSFELIPLLIIENAVKYTYSSSFSVEIRFEDPNDQTMKVFVNSYSPYCSKEDEAHIFEKGYRGKHAKRVSEGSGIGLYFVKTLCDLHGITIKAYSEKERVTDISGVAYAPFTIELSFHDVINRP